MKVPAKETPKGEQIMRIKVGCNFVNTIIDNLDIDVMRIKQQELSTKMINSNTNVLKYGCNKT